MGTPGLNPSLTQRRKFAGSWCRFSVAEPVLVLVEVLGHHLAVAEPHEQIGQGKLSAGVVQRAAGAKELGESRDQAGALGSPGAVNQQRVIGGIKRLDQRGELGARHPDARRHGDVDLGRARLVGGGDLVAIPGVDAIRSAEVQHGPDLMSGDCAGERLRRHLARPIDVVRANDAEVIVRLVPRHVERGDDHDTPIPAAAAKPLLVAIVSSPS